MTDPPGEITVLLAELRAGDRSALDRLFPLVYAELHRAAHAVLRSGRPGDTINTTALIHETYLKLGGSGRPDWQDRRHFFAVASRAMRQIVIDYARALAADKRGGGMPALAFETAEPAAPGRATELLALDEALTALAAIDARLSQIVELRFFAGLTVEETAEALDLSPRTVKREWRKARAFLYRAVRQGEE